MKERSYKFGESTLTLKFGDITSSEDQVIVSSDDYYLSMGGGVSAAILRAGGNEIAIDASKKVPAKLGDIVITTAGRLPANFIFHAITIGKNDSGLSPKDVVSSTTLKCLNLLSTLNLKTISFPAIGTGTARFKIEDVAAQMSKTISDFFQSATDEFHVTVYLFDRTGEMGPMDYISFFESFASKIPGFKQKEISYTHHEVVWAK